MFFVYYLLDILWGGIEVQSPIQTFIINKFMFLRVVCITSFINLIFFFSVFSRLYARPYISIRKYTFNIYPCNVLFLSANGKNWRTSRIIWFFMVMDFADIALSLCFIVVLYRWLLSGANFREAVPESFSTCISLLLQQFRWKLWTSFWLFAT